MQPNPSQTGPYTMRSGVLPGGKILKWIKSWQQRRELRNTSPEIFANSLFTFGIEEASFQPMTSLGDHHTFDQTKARAIFLCYQVATIFVALGVRSKSSAKIDQIADNFMSILRSRTEFFGCNNAEELRQKFAEANTKINRLLDCSRLDENKSVPAKIEWGRHSLADLGIETYNPVECFLWANSWETSLIAFIKTFKDWGL